MRTRGQDTLPSYQAASARGRERDGKIGYFFDPSTWDGSDVFLATNTNTVFVVERVRRLFERIKARGFSFEPAAEAENMM